MHYIIVGVHGNALEVTENVTIWQHVAYHELKCGVRKTWLLHIRVTTVGRGRSIFPSHKRGIPKGVRKTLLQRANVDVECTGRKMSELQAPPMTSTLISDHHQIRVTLATHIQ